MVARPLLALALLTALLPGCLDGGPSGPEAAGDPLGSAAPEGPGAGSPATHGRPDRDESDVDVERDGSQVVATQTITVRNDFGGAARSTLRLETLNGPVRVREGGDGGYALTATLHGRGATEEQAREALGLLRFTNGDGLEGGALELEFLVRRTDSGGLPVQLGPSASNGASLELVVPGGPGHRVQAEASNGAVSVSGLRGPAADLSTSNGAIEVEGSFGSVDASTSNAAVSLDGSFGDVEASTSNGAIVADVRPARSGGLDLSTSNGAIRLSLEAGEDTGVDASGQTSNGRVSISLPGASDSGTTASARTPGYDGKAVRVQVEAATSNADVTIVAG